MFNIKYVIPLLVLVFLVPSMAFAQNTGIEDNTQANNPHLPSNEIGSVGNTLLDITTLESYKLHPETTQEMLIVELGDSALTVDFGIAYDELNLIGFGYEEHIREEYVEFLEDLQINLFGKRGNTLYVGLDPIHEDNLPQIKQQLESMYPNVELDITTATYTYADDETIQYADAFTKTSTVNQAIPNGGAESITDTIIVTENAILNSISVSIRPYAQSIFNKCI